MKATGKVPPSSRFTKESFPTLCLLGWYMLFGALHEIGHIISHSVLAKIFLGTSLLSQIEPDGAITVLFRAILGRYSIIYSPTLPFNDHEEEEIQLFVLNASRHAGWILSLVVAVTLHLTSIMHYMKNTNKACDTTTTLRSMTTSTFVAYLTALEAISTDLLGFVPQNNSATEILFCGNFGIILLNQAWTSTDGGKHALDVLEKMVNVTMMRGAQCGGVVTFMEKDNSNVPELMGVRARVVNGKRDDLSVGIRRQIEKQTCNRFTGKLKGSPRGFYGHTRFATSSKATFDGCHPHQWTPPSVRSVYGPFQSKQKATKKEMKVGNYITHNGDLDFYNVNGKMYDLGDVQEWLELTTETKMPSTVDSAAIAGLVDVLRTQGCFGLSARYTISFGLPTSNIDTDPCDPFPTYKEYERIGKFFENALDIMLNGQYQSLEAISTDPKKRDELATSVFGTLNEEYTRAVASWKNDDDFEALRKKPYYALYQFIDDEAGASLFTFVKVTINAFFDNDLLSTVKTFLKNAKGSFGLGVASSLDSHRQFCIGARGQPMSVAFYPRKGLICYGSEQAAVKAGLNYDISKDENENTVEGEEAKRLDLDDLGGEICLLDWGYNESQTPAVSPPNRHLMTHKLMGGAINVTLLQESKIIHDPTNINARMTPLEGNEWIKPLGVNVPGEDLVLTDINDIPRVCKNIQKDWEDIGLNRLTGWNFAKQIEHRMKDIVEGKLNRNAGSIDILVTGCEVSLWLGEQFATDLQKAFPKLYIKAVSSNKLLGLFGQDLSVPCVGYPMSPNTNEMDEPIVIIVSHSGGTFAPLACSNLLQSFSRNIFVVTSEWDTQIGKQLRGMYDKREMISSRIFSTEIGVRPAEPCSVSVAATQQLLTNIFIHVCTTIIGNFHFRHASGAIITEADLQTLERLNQDCIPAMEDIVGVDVEGEKVPLETSQTEAELRGIGDLWAEHILENAKAYIMTFFYIIGTVTSGYPLISGIAVAAGLDTDWAFYITRFFDALIYFWLPQINILILRLIQGRNIRHRMVGRTVVVGDCPWVAQAAEAFLGKIFACSYSIAGCNVISGNPADHLVHRHTHRVVRGSLLVCGRADGRLSALTSLEATTCLSVNQASSIQSIGGTCESVTIGHNPYKLPLTHAAVFLDAHRPQFLCETTLPTKIEEDSGPEIKNTTFGKLGSKLAKFSSRRTLEGVSRFSRHGVSRSSQHGISRSSRHGGTDVTLGTSDHSSHSRLLGIYADMQKSTPKRRASNEEEEEKTNKLLSSGASSSPVQKVLREMVKESAGFDYLKKMFDAMDKDGNGEIELEEFVTCFQKVDPNMDREACIKIFQEADVDESGDLTFDEFVKITQMPQSAMISTLHTKNRSDRGLRVVPPSTEMYFGEEIRKTTPSHVKTFDLAKSQTFAMELYESRIAALQRFVAMTVLFHQMGKRVQEFFPKISFGYLGYRMDRTHSIMRIATTASPVSGADVRESMEVLQIKKTILRSVAMMSRAWLRYKQKKEGNKDS